MCFNIYIPGSLGFFHFYCFVFAVRYFSLAMKKKSQCVRTKLRFYTRIFYLIYLCRSFARGTWRRRGGGMREKGRMKRGWPRRKPRADVQSGSGLRTGRSQTLASQVQRVHGAGEASCALHCGTWRNSMIAPKGLPLGPLSDGGSPQAPRCALHSWTLFEVDRSSLLPSCRGTKPRPNGGSPAAIVKCSETGRIECSANCKVAGPLLGNNLRGTLDHSSFLVTATWLHPCLTRSHFPPRGSECVCMGVCVGCACGREGVCLNIIAP